MNRYKQKRRFKALRKMIAEAPPERFNMRCFFQAEGEPAGASPPIGWRTPHCGTAACIGGFAAIRWREGRSRYRRLERIAADALGLNSVVADRLFYATGAAWRRVVGEDLLGYLDEISRDDALAVLDIIIEEGVEAI